MKKLYSIPSILQGIVLGFTGTIAMTIPVSFPSAIAQTPQTQSDRNHDAIADRLYGFWKYTYSQNGNIGYALFASDGTLAFVEPDEYPDEYIEVIQYRIYTDIQPMQLDILYDDGLTLTIFELTPAGELRVEVAGWNQFRPSEFSDDPLSWEKVPANDPIIPQLQEKIDAEIAEREVVNPKSDLGAMSRAQQAYRIESANFADTLVQLRLEAYISSKTQTYQYDIIPHADREMGVMMTATAKQLGSYSYTSFVYVRDGNRSGYLMCESNLPSTVPPEVIVDFTDTLEPVRCGEGSREIYPN